jgi:hypothetical protein
MKDFLAKQNIGSIGVIDAYHKIYMAPHMEHFRQTLDSIPKEIKSLRKLGNYCWDTISKIRALSLCSTCSGKSDVFFSNRAAALIHLSTCTGIMSACENHLLSLIRFVIRSTEFFAGIHKYGVEEKTIQVNHNRARAEEIYNSFKAINNLDLLQVVHRYMESKDRSKEKTAALIKICEMTTDLGQEAFIVKVLPILQNIELLSKDLSVMSVGWAHNNVNRTFIEKGKNPNPILAELASLTKEPRPPARLLQSAARRQLSLSPDIIKKAFQGDVEVFDSGLTHSNKDTSSNYNSKPLEAMDLSLKDVFP